MDRHIELGNKLSEVTGLATSRIHWQPGASTSLKYPCIVYELPRSDTVKADNRTYLIHDRYSVTHIYKDDASSKKDDILNSFEMISHDSRQIVDGLYHDYFTVYF